MDFKHLNTDKNKTPKSKSNIVGKVFSSTVNCDSPFRLLPNFSTPPSRFSKIINPFESHLLDRLHLPTFSPSVFAQASTPKTDEKFKWSIDDISNLKPADIDETTIDQHVYDHDPNLELLVQEKINKFFSEKVIVPSPMCNNVEQSAQFVARDDSSPPSKQFAEGSTQTILTLPPNLPQHVEDILKPYFTYTQDQQQNGINKDSSMYRNLFEFDDQTEKSQCNSIESSPALSTGLSPIQFSPLSVMDRRNDSCGHMDRPELRGCTLSPIGRKSPKESRSACRLSFSGRMSIDASLIVPDIGNQSTTGTNNSVFLEDNVPLVLHEALSDSTVNWDMEYKHITNSNSSSDSERMDVSNANTPHSRMFPSQRKRLSDSFKDEMIDFNGKDFNPIETVDANSSRRVKSKMFRDDLTDAGYQTGSAICEDSAWNYSHLFASTPSKKRTE